MKGKAIMAIKIGNYNFDGPHHQTGGLYAQSGVYVILGKTGNTNWVVLDVGESHCVRERVESLTGDLAGHNVDIGNWRWLRSM